MIFAEMQTDCNCNLIEDTFMITGISPDDYIDIEAFNNVRDSIINGEGTEFDSSKLSKDEWYQFTLKKTIYTDIGTYTNNNVYTIIDVKITEV